MAKRSAKSRPVASSRLVRDLDEKGGFTVHEATGDRPEVGYAVSDFGAEERIPPPGAGEGDIEQYRAREAGKLAGDRKFFGGWRDNNEGRGPHDADYLDVSTVVGTRREAFDIGHTNAQRAVMDLASFTEHSVPFPPGLPGPNRTGQTPREYHASEGQNRELGRRMIENQRHGRQDPSQAKERGAAIADDLVAREQLHAEVRGMHPRAQVKRGKR